MFAFAKQIMEKWGRFVIVAFWLLCFATMHCNGQIVPEQMSHDRYALYYYQDRIDIQYNYLDNAYQISRIKNILANSARIDSITIYAYASPEGSYSRNVWLANQRALAARKFILANLPDSTILAPENIHLRPMGENWEGLEAELEANYHLANRDRVMKIMHARVSTETKKWRLKNLDNGYTYSIIIRDHMPRLRLATWICVYAPYKELRIDLKDTPLEFPQRIEPITTVAPLYERRTILALKSNLLYDAATLLNYSVEVPMTKHFSALFYHQFPWWRWGEGRNEYCIRFLSIGGEARWWFKPGNNPKRDRLTGHFLGVYGESGKWDFEWKRDICYQGEHWSAGISYGYAMPLGKHFNLEFSLSLGYASIAYRKYTPSSDYEILWRDPDNTGRWHYFGPTKVQVSLVLPITVKSTKKGGSR